MSNSDDITDNIKKVAKNITENMIPKIINENKETIEAIGNIATNIGVTIKKQLENIDETKINDMKDQAMDSMVKNKEKLKDIFDKLNTKDTD